MAPARAQNDGDTNPANLALPEVLFRRRHYIHLIRSRAHLSPMLPSARARVAHSFVSQLRQSRKQPDVVISGRPMFLPGLRLLHD